jgi:glycosyltransferase involved in cell wall biosynthesis
MIIAHLCHGFFPGNGFETFITELCNHDINNKNIIILPKGKNAEIGLKPNIEIIEISSFSELPKLFEKIKPDIFLIHWTGAEGLIKDECKLVMQNTRCYYDLKPGVIRTLDNDPFGYLYTSRLIKNTPVYIIAHSEFKIPQHVQRPEITGLIAVSDKALKSFENNNFDKHIIYNGVDTEKFKKREVNRISKSVVVSWSGRLSKYDFNVYQAIKNDKYLSDNCIFVYLGDGKLEDDPPANHLFLGKVDNVARWLNTSDIFLYPTLIDSFGLALVEAMACQLPVIGSQEVSEIIGNAGFVYPSPSVCVNILKDVVKSVYTREVFGKIARQRAIENFSIDRMVENYNKLYWSSK